MTQRTDYSQIDVPDEKDPEEYHYTERRAEILQLVLRAGGPAAITQTTLADRYGVDKSTISRDLDRLSESIAEGLGNRLDLQVKAAFEKVLAELLEDGEYREAWDVVLDWAEWLGDAGHADVAPDELELSGDLSHDNEVDLSITHQRVTGDDLPDAPDDAD